TGRGDGELLLGALFHDGLDAADLLFVLGDPRAGLLVELRGVGRARPDVPLERLDLERGGLDDAVERNPERLQRGLDDLLLDGRVRPLGERGEELLRLGDAGALLVADPRG